MGKVTASDAVDVLSAAGVTVVPLDHDAAELDLGLGVDEDRVRIQLTAPRTPPTIRELARVARPDRPAFALAMLDAAGRLQETLRARTVDPRALEATTAAMRAVLPADLLDRTTSVLRDVALRALPQESMQRVMTELRGAIGASLPPVPEGAPSVTYVVEQANESLRLAAQLLPQVSVVSVRDRSAIIAGHQLDATDAPKRQQAPARRGRVPWGRYALMRALARTREPRTQSELAVECGLSQAAISQHLTALGGEVERGRGHVVATAFEPLWDRFLLEYPGPRGLRTAWYSLDPVPEQVQRLTREAPDEAVLLVSGDAAADLLAPWRMPRRTVAYAREGFDPSSLGFTAALSSEATLELIVPTDATIWSTARAWRADRGATAEIVDPLIAAWDVLRSGGPDAEDAARHLRDQAAATWQS